MVPPRQTTIKTKARMEETITLVEQQDIETRITQMQSSAEPQQISDPFMSALLAGAEHLHNKGHCPSPSRPGLQEEEKHCHRAHSQRHNQVQKLQRCKP